MNLIDRLVVSVVGDTAALKKSLADSKKQLSGFGAAVQKHSAAFMKTGAVMMGFAGAIGIAAIKVGKEFDKAYNKIRTGTGKTGKVLEGLKKDFRAVVKDVPNSLDEVSTAIADLNTRLGLTGKPLQDMAKQMLNLARITETDVNAVIRTSTRLFGDWDVAVEDQAETLDYLYRVSQSTGIGIGKLSDLTTTYGVQLRSVGFSIEDSLALMGRWEKEGVSIEKMLGGLSMALGKFALAQEDPVEAFNELVESIKNSSVEAGNLLGVQKLGTRAGADFAAAVREGRFDLDDFKKALADSTDTIDQAAKDTMTLTEKFNLLKNQAKLAIEPLAKKLMDELTPALEKITDKLGDLDEEQLENIASSVLWAAKIVAVGGAFIFAMGAVGKFSAAVKVATGFMATFHATALGPWGILAAVIASTTLLTGDSIRDLTELTEDQTKALNEAADAVDELIPPHRNLAGAEKDVRIAMGELYGIAKEYPQVCDQITNKMLPLIESYKKGDITAEELAEGLNDLVKATKGATKFAWKYTGAIEGQTKKSIEAKIATQDNENVLNSLMEQYDLTREEAIKYAKAEGLLEDVTDDATGAIEDQEDAVDDLRSSFNKLLRTLFDGITTYNDFEESQIAVKEAQAKVNKLIEEGKKGTDEYIKAENELDDSVIRLIEDSFALSKSTDVTTKQQEEARRKAVELGLEYVNTGKISIEKFEEMASEFGLSSADIILYAEGMGIKLDEVTKDRTVVIGVDATGVPRAVQKVLDELGRIKDKTIKITTRQYYEALGAVSEKEGGIVGYLKGGITGSDGFSLPILTAAQGLITLPQADEGMLALLHPPELVLNPEQALRVLWKIANEPTGAKSSSPDYSQDNRSIVLPITIELDGQVIYEKTSEYLYDQKQTKQRGLGEK